MPSSKPSQTISSNPSTHEITMEMELQKVEGHCRIQKDASNLFCQMKSRKNDGLGGGMRSGLSTSM